MAAATRLDRRGALGGERLDLLLDLRPLRSIRIGLQIAAPRIDRDLGVAGVLRRRRQLLQVRRVAGSNLHCLLVVGDGRRERARRLLVQRRCPGRRRLRGSLIGRVLSDRRPERPAGQEGRAGIGGLSRLLCALIPRRVGVPLRHLDAAELAPRRRILRLHREVALERNDRLLEIALLLVRRREVAVALRGILLYLVLSLGDRAAAATAEEAGVELLEPAPVA